MVTALKNLHFDVTPGLDLKYDQANLLVDSFINKIDAIRPFVTVIYYSGHGLQIQEENFIVPVDFQHDNYVRLLSVQRILERVSNYSTLQIILLDACRTNFEAENILRGKAIAVSGGKPILGRQEPKAGFAEMHGPSSTFIAFAAAPGDLAFDGDTLLSPFTEAFLKHVDRVDLPLSNLMSRVRQEVFKATDQRQRTWDHSSLMTPFYFNPGSMFLFMGNAMALCALIISLIPYSLLLSSSESTEHFWRLVLVSLSFPMLSLCILMFGTQTVYSRLRGTYQSETDGVLSLKQHTLDCLKRGAVGGYLSSLIAAIGFSAVIIEIGSRNIMNRSAPFLMIFLLAIALSPNRYRL